MAINISDLDIALRKNKCEESRFEVYETYDKSNSLAYGVFYARVGDSKYVLFDEISVLAELVRRKNTLTRAMFIANALAILDNIIKKTHSNWVEHTIELYINTNTVGMHALNYSDRYLMAGEAAEAFALNGYGYEYGAVGLLHTIMINACMLATLDSEETIYKNIDNGVITWNTTSETYFKGIDYESIQLFTGNKVLDDMHKKGIPTINVDWTYQILKDLSNKELALIANERVVEPPDTAAKLDENSPRELLLEKARIFLAQFRLLYVNDKHTISIIIKIVNRALQMARDTLEKHGDEVAFTLDEIEEIAFQNCESLDENEAYKILKDSGMEDPYTVKINDIYNLSFNNIDLDYTEIRCSKDQIKFGRSYLGDADLKGICLYNIRKTDVQIIPQDKLLNIASKLRVLGKSFAFYIPELGLPTVFNKTDEILYTHSYENISGINNITWLLTYPLAYSRDALIVPGLLCNLRYYIEGKKREDNKK